MTKETQAWIRRIEEQVSKIVLAANLYSQSGDESNSKLEFRKLQEEARSILINEVNNSLNDLASHMKQYSNVKQ